MPVYTVNGKRVEANSVEEAVALAEAVWGKSDLSTPPPPTPRYTPPPPESPLLPRLMQAVPTFLKEAGGVIAGIPGGIVDPSVRALNAAVDARQEGRPVEAQLRGMAAVTPGLSAASEFVGSKLDEAKKAVLRAWGGDALSSLDNLTNIIPGVPTMKGMVTQNINNPDRIDAFARTLGQSTGAAVAAKGPEMIPPAIQALQEYGPRVVQKAAPIVGGAMVDRALGGSGMIGAIAGPVVKDTLKGVFQPTKPVVTSEALVRGVPKQEAQLILDHIKALEEDAARAPKPEPIIRGVPKSEYEILQAHEVAKAEYAKATAAAQQLERKALASELSLEDRTALQQAKMDQAAAAQDLVNLRKTSAYDQAASSAEQKAAVQEAKQTGRVEDRAIGADLKTARKPEPVAEVPASSLSDLVQQAAGRKPGTGIKFTSTAAEDAVTELFNNNVKRKDAQTLLENKFPDTHPETLKKIVSEKYKEMIDKQRGKSTPAKPAPAEPAPAKPTTGRAWQEKNLKNVTDPAERKRLIDEQSMKSMPAGYTPGTPLPSTQPPPGPSLESLLQESVKAPKKGGPAMEAAYQQRIKKIAEGSQQLVQRMRTTFDPDLKPRYTSEDIVAAISNTFKVKPEEAQAVFSLITKKD